MTLNGAEIRKALAAVPEAPHEPSVLSHSSGNFTIDTIQAVPLHADRVLLSVSTDGNVWEDGADVVVGVSPGGYVTVPTETSALVRFVAVNANGRTEGPTLTLTN